MATLGTFFSDDEDATVSSPLCSYQRRPCWRKGRAAYGPPRDVGESVNRSIVCLTCGATGDASATKALRHVSGDGA
jgi:hypothetical protein